MYIWSHGFEVASTARYDSGGSVNNNDFYFISGSNDSHVQTATVTGAYGTGWFSQVGNAIFVSSPTAWYITKDASRMVPWNLNGPTGEWGLRMTEPGQTVGPQDPVSPYRLNIQPEGFGDLQNVAVSFDCRFEAGAILARGKTDVGICRLTTKFTSDGNEYPDGSNFTPLVVDVNSAGQVELWMYNSATSVIEFKVASTRSLPTGKWFRMTVHLEWPPAYVGVNRVQATVYVDGAVWVGPNYVQQPSGWANPVKDIQGFRLGYVIDRPDPAVTPDANFQDFDNVVMFVHPTQEELTTNYYCIPIWPADNGDNHDVIQKTGPGLTDTWDIYDGAFGIATTTFSGAVNPNRNLDINRAPVVAAIMKDSADGEELVLRPEIPSVKWGNNYNPNQLSVIGVNSIQSFGMSTASYGGDPSATKFQKAGLGTVYFGYQGWRSGGQSRYQNSWPHTSVGSFQFTGDHASMWWSPSPYKQVSGSNWDGLNPNFANMTNFTNGSWVDDFEKGAIPFLVRSANDLSATTPWMTFAGVLEVCASWSVPSAAYDKKPDAQLIIKDKLFDADRIAKPYPTQVSPYMGLPYADVGNMGTLLPFMEGFWDTEGGENSAGADLHLQLSETGSLGYDATYSWRFADETNQSLRGYMDQNMHWGHHNPFANLGIGPFVGWSNYNISEAVAKRSAHCVGYSTQNERLLVFWYNAEKNAYAIAHKNMSNAQRGVATPEATTPYTYVKFDGGYTGGAFPDNKQIGEDCPYCAVVELADGTMRFFHCYRDTNHPVTDGWIGIFDTSFTSGFYNIDMYASIDGGLTWTLEKERVMDAPFGGSRIIRHMVAAADGDWIRLDFQFYDTMLSGDFYWLPGRLSMASGDRGASWAAIETPQGKRPDGYDVSMGNAASGIYTSSPSTPLWSIPKVTYRTDETAAICGSGRGDGSFYRFRSTYNQNGNTGVSYVNRYGYLTGWGLDVDGPSAAKWEGGITLNVFERGDRGDSWGFIDTPSATSGRGMDGIRSLSYGDVARYAVATPAAAYFGQVTIESRGSVGLFLDGARWDGRFSWCVPSSDPYNYSKESGALVAAYIYQTKGSYYPAAKNVYDPTLEQYLQGWADRDEFFDPSGLDRRGGMSWGLVERSIDAVWAGDRVAVSSTLTAKDILADYGIPVGLPVPDPSVMPVCVSFMGGWEKRPIRRLDGWSDYWKPQLWSRDWTAARGWVGVQTLPAVAAGTYLYPGRAAFTPSGGYPWTQFAYLAGPSAAVVTAMNRNRPSVSWRFDAPGVQDNWGWFASDTWADLAVGTTTQGDTQLMAHGGIVDCCVYTQYDRWPYNLGNGPQRTEYNTTESRYSGPQRGFTIETARNNTLTGGSTVFMGIQCNVIAPAQTNLSDPTNALYKGQVNIYESAYDVGTSSMYAARTLFSGDFSAPTASMRASPYPINIRLALVDGYTLSPATTYTFIQAMYRENLSNDDWTVSGLLTIVGAANATASLLEQRFLFGMMEGGSQGPISYHNEWCHMRWGVGRESHMGAGFPDHARASLGALCAAFPLNITQNVAARWGGSSGFQGDRFTAPIKYSYGTDQIGFSSPQMHWRSTTAAATESIIYYAPQTETTDLETYYRHNAIGLFNTNKRKMEITYATDTTFSSVTTTFTVDATRYADAIVTSAGKDTFQVEYTSSRKWKQNELVGMYAELKKGADTYIKRVTANWDDQVQLQGLPSAITNFVDIWTTTSFYGSDVVHFMRGVPNGIAAKAMRVQFAPGTTATTGAPPEGYWKLGALVPGMTFGFDVPLNWQDTQDEEPNIILTTTDSGIRTAYKQGEPRRSFKGGIEGDIDRFRDSLRLTLRNLADYNKRPMVLSLDSQNPNIQSMYCRWTKGVTFKNEGWRFNSDTLTWERVGSMNVEFEEEI
jgi:hypothetical protein